MDYKFEKSEYNYYAAALIFGIRSPHMKNFSAFSMDIFRKNNLVFSEMDGLMNDGILGIVRHLKIDDNRLFRTSHSDMRSGINKIVTYVDNQFMFHLSDSLFSDQEFEYFKQDWNETTQNKIHSLGMLIRAIQVRNVRDIPLLINEYLNITKTLLDHSDFFLVGKNAIDN